MIKIRRDLIKNIGKDRQILFFPFNNGNCKNNLGLLTIKAHLVLVLCSLLFRSYIRVSDLASPPRRKAEPGATAREPHGRLINLRPMSLKRISAR